uniref:C3H1-type domain-containing protein n=1 Tax=Kalanchoe fedtschenkoi TaxID=63787 RepID=A0A7N0ZVW8_KALFE
MRDVHRHPRYNPYPCQPSLPPPPLSADYPNFCTNLPQPPPPPPPDFQPPLFHHPSSPFSFRSPNCTPPIEHPLDFRASRPHPDRFSVFPRDFPFSSRVPDDWEPSSTYNSGPIYQFQPSSPRRVVVSQHHFTGMDLAPRYDISTIRPNTDFSRSSGDGYFGRRSISSVSSHSDIAHRGWSSKRQHLQDTPNSSSGVRLDEGVGAPPRNWGNPRYSSRANYLDPPRKVQKKSALFRIQMGNSVHSNYSHMKSRISGRCRSGKTSAFEVNCSSPAKHRNTKEGGNARTEGNPAHMSFKSNSLVAKQSITPSSPTNTTDKDFTPRNRKFGKLTAPDSMKLGISGHSAENSSRHLKTNEQTVGSECDIVCETDCDKADRFDKEICVEGFNASSGKSMAMLEKRNKLLHDQTPSDKLADNQSWEVSLLTPKTYINCKGSDESCQLEPEMPTGTGSGLIGIACSATTVVSVDDLSHHPFHQHVDVATRVNSLMPYCGNQLANIESPVLKDCIHEEVVSDIPAAEVSEIDRPEYLQAKKLISPLETDVPFNTVVDQSCSEDATENDIIEEHAMPISADENNNLHQDNGICMTNMKKRKETSIQYEISDWTPTATALERDLIDKVVFDFSNGDCMSPNQAEMEKELICVVDKGLTPVDVSVTDFEVTSTQSKGAAQVGLRGGGSTLVPGSPRAMISHNEGFSHGISKIVQGSSESSRGMEITTSKTVATADSDPDIPSTMASLERVAKGQITYFNTLFDLKSNDMAPGDDKKEVNNSVARTNSGHTMLVESLPLPNVVTPAHISSISSTHNQVFSNATSERLKCHRNYVLPVPFRTSSSLYFTSPKIEEAHKVRMVKSRTWHRSKIDVPLPDKMSASNVVHSRCHLMKGRKPQSTSYIRKGNSLVRNPSPVVNVSGGAQDSTSVTQPSFPNDQAFFENKFYDTIEPNQSGTSDDKVNIQRYEACQLLEKTTPTVSNCSPVESPCLSPMSPVVNCSSEINSGPMGSPDDTGLVQFHDEMKQKKVTENQIVALNSLGTQTAVDKGSISAKPDSIMYLKHNSYQLVAASGPSHLSVEKAQDAQILSSDGYYKMKNNQIIRTPLDTAQPPPVSGGNLNTEGLHAENMFTGPSTLQSYKGTMHKSSNSSLVWTLHGAQPTSKMPQGQVRCKRATSWRDMRNSGASLINRSSLMIRMLTLCRCRNTIYKRSTNGLSLRKYKVLALDGYSLKWSKSIERRSKKASEDATRAVVAAESKKREQNRLQRTMSKEKNKLHSSRGRIFRIGAVRYRMDPSRNTLQRIIDGGSQPGALEDADSKGFYVPKRLVIGKDEYIRIGNGNQLIRDPKKRIRMLANEKIKWSLHNVRLRLVKKRRFCQFYTRFGKCNKDDGKCPFIHDSSKIAVCTKFLKGICFEPNCKLTHKVIPERMEDCAYFLLGMCSNESCPYRHVNVNPNATTCEGFLKGYCADGDECQKKHSYVCHVFEETGTCPQGSKCKLHHPKKRKVKQTNFRMQNSAKGRYFGSPPPGVGPQTVVLMKHLTASSANIFEDGYIPDFISLHGGGDNDVEDISCASENVDNFMDIEVCDLDTLIKPVGIMNKDLGKNT